ncbi:MAG: hypothetical protein IT463_01450 [Planctomycetes bacterium]|nr:hypothetical protein [Planctomycetota bacterium]
MERVEYSGHARHRAKNRSISGDAIDAVMTWGRLFHAGKGCLAYFLGRRIVLHLRRRLGLNLDRYRDIAVIESLDGMLVTVEHLSRPPRHWRPG